MSTGAPIILRCPGCDTTWFDAVPFCPNDECNSNEAPVKATVLDNEEEK